MEKKASQPSNMTEQQLKTLKDAQDAKTREERELEVLRQDMESNYKVFKQQESEAMDNNQKLKSDLTNLKQQLKEKEQLVRISNFKLNELRRRIKHGSLKPLPEAASSKDKLRSNSSSVVGIENTE